MTWRRALMLSLLALGPLGALGFTRSLLPDTAERQEIYAEGTRVLIVAVSKYRDPGWADLNAHRDAERIRAVFLQRGVPESSITTVEPEPEREPDIQAALVRFAESLPAESDRPLHVVVYIAGHGYTADGLGYLVPPNAPDPLRQPAAFNLAALPLPTLLARVATFRAEHVLLILDACFSGMALEALPRERFPHPSTAGALRDGKVLQVITAGTAGQTVADDGLFSELVSNGLTGAADLNFDGWISGTELGMYLRLRMTESSGRRQTPAFGNILGLSAKYTQGENWFASPQRTLQSATSRLQVVDSNVPAFRDCEDCPTLRVVPGPMLPGDTGSLPYFAMGVREVSFEEFDACFKAGGCTHWPLSVNGERGRLPVTDVNMEDAREYAQWLSCITGSRYRLPTDAEWLTVARTELRRFAKPGSLKPASLANCRGCGSRWDGETVAPTGSFAAGDLGLHDLVGNVWEWTDECSTTGHTAQRCVTTVVRGGAFTTRRSTAITLPAGKAAPLSRDRNIGFRVLRELEDQQPLTRASCEAVTG